MSTKEKTDYDWMDMRLWRFWLPTINEAIAFKKHISFNLKPWLRYIQRFGCEVRFQLAEHCDEHLDFVHFL